MRIGEEGGSGNSGEPIALDPVVRLARNNLQLYEKVLEDPFQSHLDRVKSNTQCSLPALYDFFLSVRHVNAANIPGDILEVGCWRGGALGLALLADISKSRRVIGFDTFQGHFEPPSYESDIRGQNMAKRFNELREQGLPWNKADFELCQEFLYQVAADNSRVILVPGDVKSTAHQFPPQRLSVKFFGQCSP